MIHTIKNSLQPGGELADTRDLKSLEEHVPVQVRPWAQFFLIFIVLIRLLIKINKSESLLSV